MLERARRNVASERLMNRNGMASAKQVKERQECIVYTAALFADMKVTLSRSGLHVYCCIWETTE